MKLITAIVTPEKLDELLLAVPAAGVPAGWPSGRRSGSAVRVAVAAGRGERTGERDHAAA